MKQQELLIHSPSPEPCQHPWAFPCQATPIATTTSQQLPALPQSFFARPAVQVAPDLIGCLLVKRQPDGEQLWGVIVETEAYSQEEPACHGYRRRSPSNERCLVSQRASTCMSAMPFTPA